VISQQVCCRAVSGLSLLFEILLRWFLSLPSSAPQDHDAASIAFRTVSAISVTLPANASTLFFKTAYFGIKGIALARVVYSMRQRNYRVDRGGSLDYLRAAAQAVGVSPASR